eukprot:6203172-Pleurochrysis_carterae.AAC.1
MAMAVVVTQVSGERQQQMADQQREAAAWAPPRDCQNGFCLHGIWAGGGRRGVGEREGCGEGASCAKCLGNFTPCTKTARLCRHARAVRE